MSETQARELERIERYPDGKIPASRRYIKYGGQLVIRTRYGTIQRWKTSGWDRKEGPALAPYILHSDYCSGESDALAPRNEHLDVNQFEIFYVDDGDKVVYEVSDTDQPEADQ